MMDIFGLDSAEVFPWVVLLMDIVIKGLLVLLIAAGVTLIFRRRASASTRHLVWTLAMLVLLTLPILALALPGLAVPFLPDWADLAPPEPETTSISEDSTEIDNTQVVTETSITSTGLDNAQWAGPMGQSDFPLVEAPGDLHPQPRTAAVVPSEAPAAVAATAPEPDASSEPASPPAHWSAWALPVWLLGMAALLLPLLAGTLAIAWQVRRGQVVTEENWQALLDELRGRLGVRRRVWLLQSSWSNIPVTCGILRPKILLPASADTWCDDRRRIVLLHELAHIRRGDCFTQLLGRLARALYWFNPLVWLAGRMLRIEREQACDDLVLTAGHRPSDYAQHLLDIVQSLHAVRCPSLAAVAMARRSQFEGRLLAILDPNRRRKALTRIGIIAALVATLCFAIPLACMTPSEPDAATETDPAAESAAGMQDQRLPGRELTLEQATGEKPEATADKRVGVSDSTIASRRSSHTGNEAEEINHLRRPMRASFIEADTVIVSTEILETGRRDEEVRLAQTELIFVPPDAISRWLKDRHGVTPLRESRLVFSVSPSEPPENAVLRHVISLSEISVEPFDIDALELGWNLCERNVVVSQPKEDTLSFRADLHLTVTQGTMVTCYVFGLHANIRIIEAIDQTGERLLPYRINGVATMWLKSRIIGTESIK